MTHKYLNKILQKMRCSRSSFIVCTLLCVVFPIHAQQSSTSVPSQDGLSAVEAKSALIAALKPVGEEQSIRNLDRCVVTGNVKQGEATGAFTWKSAGHEFWSDTDVASVHILTGSNHGKPMSLTGGKTRELPKSFMSNPVPLYNVGMSLLRSKDDSTVGISVAPATATSALNVRFTQAKPKDQDIEAGYETWTFDPRTGLPSSHVLKPFMYRGRPLTATIQYAFSDYRQVSGVNVPHHIEQSMDDQLIRSFDIKSFQCGVAFSGHEFEVGGGGTK